MIFYFSLKYKIYYLFEQTHLVEGLYLGAVSLGSCEIVLQHLLSILHSGAPPPQLQMTAGPGTQEEPAL